MKRVKIHIDRLSLEGFDHVDRAAVRAHIERELARVVSDGLPQASRTVERADGGQVALPRSPTSSQLGGTVATAVRKTIQRAGKP